jgi:hypothetical protein
LQKGDYDKAISKSVKILTKKPDKIDEISNLEKAFSMANKKDIENIKQLKLSGQADIYDKVVFHYDRLIDRQEIVERLPDQLLSKIRFKHTDYSTELVESKKKAAEFFNAHANNLMKTGDKLDARQAYDEYNRVKEYFPGYYQIDQKINEAESRGTNNVIFIIENESRTAMPEDFEDELLKVSLKSLNKKWINFDTYRADRTDYDYSIYLSIKQIVTSPEIIKEIHYDEKKTVSDGFDYVLDGNGNVKKDSSGNDIKVPKYKVISCHVTETKMSKNASVSGSLDFYDNRTNQLIKTLPVSSSFVFDYSFATAQGNLKALKKETRDIIGLRIVPFPSDLQMIFDTNEDLKSRVKSIIASNRKILLY